MDQIWEFEDVNSYDVNLDDDSGLMGCVEADDVITSVSYLGMEDFDEYTSNSCEFPQAHDKPELVCYNRPAAEGMLFSGDYISYLQPLEGLDPREDVFDDAVEALRKEHNLDSGEANMLKVMVFFGVGFLPPSLERFRGKPVTFKSVRPANMPRFLSVLTGGRGKVCPIATFHSLSKARVVNTCYIAADGSTKTLSGSGQHVITGVRTKLDGAPYWTMTYGNETVLYGPTIRRTDISVPSLLERVGDSFYALEPQTITAFDPVVHDHFEATLDSYDVTGKMEIMARVDGIEYKVKNDHTVDLKAENGNLYDSKGRIRGAIEDKSVVGIVEVSMINGSVKRTRPDKLHAQSGYTYRSLSQAVRPQDLFNGVKRRTSTPTIPPIGTVHNDTSVSYNVLCKPGLVVKRTLTYVELFSFIRTDWARGVPFRSFVELIRGAGYTMSYHRLLRLIDRIGGTIMGDRIFGSNIPCLSISGIVPQDEFEVINVLGKYRTFRSDIIFPFHSRFKYFSPHMVFALVVNNGRVFITRPPAAMLWDVTMMGLARGGETNEQAFDRELSEEVGNLTIERKEGPYVVRKTLASSYGYVISGTCETREGRESMLCLPKDALRMGMRNDARIIIEWYLNDYSSDVG